MTAALIAGPTASGKSALAIALARRLRAEGREALIINADASQVYADIPIISAAPSPEEMAEIPHALFGYIAPEEACNAARWANDACAMVLKAAERGVIPILVGGTGMYIRTLLDGIAPVPDIAADIRDAVRAMPVAEAYARLSRSDPQAAQRLNPNDSTRIARALEVVLSTGRTLADWQTDKEGGIGDQLNLSAIVMLPPRDWLRERCALRWDAMMAAGALDEVRALIARQLDTALPAMRAIGVPELVDLLAGRISAEEARARAIAATRQYAKRQYTWFRHQPPPAWTRAEQELNNDEIANLAILLHQSLLTY